MDERLSRPISSLRVVTVHWEWNEHLPFATDMREEYVLFQEDVLAFLDATVHLHYSPGRADGAPTRKCEMITSAPFEITGPYWWSTPGIGETKPDQPGAQFLEPALVDGRQVLWESPEKQVRDHENFMHDD